LLTRPLLRRLAIILPAVACVLCLLSVGPDTRSLLAATGTAQAQTSSGNMSPQPEASTWAKTYRSKTTSTGQGVTLMPNGDLLVTGQQQGLLVARLSPAGEVLWSKVYGTAADNVDITPVAIACSPSGALVCYGNKLVRLDDSGGVTWARDYSVTVASDPYHSTQFTDVIQLSSGKFVLCGKTGDSQVFLCQVDRGGIPEWTRSYSLDSWVGRPRVFSLSSGGLLVGGTIGPDASAATYGIKLMWVTADGKVTRSQAYYDSTEPTSSYGQLMNMAVTPEGPVFCQYRFSRGCFGTNVVKLDAVGNVVWSTWVGGLRYGGPLEASLWGIDVGPAGSLVLVGATTEFSGRDEYGYDGMAEKLSPEGEILWISTMDREIFMSAGHAGASVAAVTALSDGGLVWAATSRRQQTSEGNLFVIRMGPDGTAGKLKSYLTRVDVGDTRLVRVEHPSMELQPASRDSFPAKCESQQIEVLPRDAELSAQEVEGQSVPILQPLYPADPATPSTIMPGGTMYRYYRVVDDQGRPVEGLEIRYKGAFSSSSYTTTSDSKGEIVFSFPVPRSTKEGHYEHTLSIDRVRLKGRRITLAEVPNFATDVRPLSWSTNWSIGSGIQGKVGVGLGEGVFGAFEQQAGMVVTRTEADPAKEGKGSLTVLDSLSSEVALGVQEQIGKLRLGTVEATAGEFSVKTGLGTFTDFATLFDQPSACSTQEKLMAMLTLLCGLEHSLTQGTTALVPLVENVIVSALSSDVELEHITGGLSLRVSAEGTGLGLKLTKNDQNSGGGLKSLGGINFLKLNVGERALAGITGYPPAGEVSGKVGLETGFSFSVAEVLGYQLLSWAPSTAFSLEVVADAGSLSCKRAVLTVVPLPDSRGEAQETRFTVDLSFLGPIAQTIVEELRALVPSPVAEPGVRVFFSKEFCAELMQGLLNSIPLQIPYERVVTRDKNPVSLEVGLGVGVGGDELDLAVKPTWGRYQSFPVERGLFVVADKESSEGRMVKLEEYPASLFSNQVDTLPKVLKELAKAVEELLAKTWDFVTGALSTATDTVLSVGAGVGSALADGATVVFEAGTELLGEAFPAGPTPGPALASTQTVSLDEDHLGRKQMADVSRPLWAASSNKKVSLIGTSGDGSEFAVGGIYLLEPEAALLSRPVTLTVRYSTESSRGRDPGSFVLYRFNPQDKVWLPVSASHDRASQTVTARVTEMGAYCVGSDTTAPEFLLVLPAGDPAVVSTAEPKFIVTCHEEGSGLVPSSFKATLDGQPLGGTWSVANRRAELSPSAPLAPGEHALVVEGIDGAGNHGTATFTVVVSPAPAQPTLAVAEANQAQVELVIGSAGQVPQQPTGQETPAKAAKYQILRTAPGPGLTYRLLATLDGDSLRYVDTDIAPGQTYRYMAVALSPQGSESLPSEPVTVTIPGTPVESTTVITSGGQTTTEQSSTTLDRESLANSKKSSWARLGSIIGFSVAGVALLVAVGLLIALRRR